MFRVVLILALLCFGRSALAETELGVEGSRFTVNGNPTFLLGISYYGGLGAPRQFIERDLDDMRRLGFNWIRVWATWGAFESHVSAVNQEGELRQPYFDRLKWLIAECDRREMIVDVTLSRDEGSVNVGRLPTLDAHRQAVESLSSHLKPFRNWYLDLANENDVRGKERSGASVVINDLRKLRDRVKQFDPDRLVTCSTTGEFDKRELRDYVVRAGMDFFSPHRPRALGSPKQTADATRRCLAAMSELECIAPVHYQEPFRRGWRSDRWEPMAEDFLTDLKQAVDGGAAGWCFHNGDSKKHPEGKPRRSFDMRERRLFEQLDQEERKVVEAAGRVLTQAQNRRTLLRRSSATGPLRVHPDSPRYFTDGSGRAIFLTGSHVWNNLQDMGPGDPPPLFDFAAYLDFLEKYGHNFIRLWTWEHTTWDTKANGRWGKKTPHTVAPHPWARTGPNKALDGKPKFDLTKFNPVYFERLRSRVVAAGNRGIYVSVMLFEGWAMQHNAWNSHPFNPKNNVNGIDGDADGDGQGLEIHTLANRAVTALQESYVRKVIETLNDQDNVLYEISNENHAASTKWQYHMIDFIHAYEKRKPKQHPVGMTFQNRGGSNKTLFDSPADWISPNNEGGYRDNPPVAEGRKIILSDTDHLWGIGGNQAWVWKSFLRGLNPIFMDPYDGVVLAKPFDPQWEPIRRSMGYARRFSERINLAACQPHNKLASTKYCLANPGREYLVYLPDGGKATVDLSAAKAALSVEWFDPSSGETKKTKAVRGGARRDFTAPFGGDAVLYLRRAESTSNLESK